MHANAITVERFLFVLNSPRYAYVTHDDADILIQPNPDTNPRYVPIDTGAHKLALLTKSRTEIATAQTS